MRIFVAIGLVGGAWMVVAAALALGEATVPLALIGGTWLVMGVWGLWQRRRIAFGIDTEGTVPHSCSRRRMFACR
jgi:hypothetical protein